MAAEGGVALDQAENQKLALLLGFAMGVAAAALGVRLVMPLLEARIVEELARGHRNLLIGFDVLVTGALLGGGASGLHSVLDLVLKEFDLRRERLRWAEINLPRGELGQREPARTGGGS